MKTVYTDERLTRLTRLIREYRATKRRHLLERMMKVWRRSEADRKIAALAETPERMH